MFTFINISKRFALEKAFLLIASLFLLSFNLILLQSMHNLAIFWPFFEWFKSCNKRKPSWFNTYYIHTFIHLDITASLVTIRISVIIILQFINFYILSNFDKQDLVCRSGRLKRKKQSFLSPEKDDKDEDEDWKDNCKLVCHPKKRQFVRANTWKRVSRTLCILHVRKRWKKALKSKRHSPELLLL